MIMIGTTKSYTAPFAEITNFSSEAFMNIMWSGEHDIFDEETSSYEYTGDEEP